MAGAPVIGHEFWIEPSTYTLDDGTPLTAQLKNGENFVGSNYSYIDSRFTRFDLIGNGQTMPVSGRNGDLPALVTLLPGTGLWTIVHETTPNRLTYTE
ncbi:MAG: DUF4198 domain-containing protein, partial [Pseudomonadota bacterium]